MIVLDAYAVVGVLRGELVADEEDIQAIPLPDTRGHRWSSPGLSSI